MERYLLKELLEFFIRQKEMDCKVITAVVEIMQEESIPMYYRIEACVQVMKKNGLVSIEDRLAVDNDQIIPMEEFKIEKFDLDLVFWEVLN